MFSPDGRYIFVTSPEHIKEVDTTPDTVLSLQAASKQVPSSRALYKPTVQDLMTVADAPTSVLNARLQLVRPERYRGRRLYPSSSDTLDPSPPFNPARSSNCYLISLACRSRQIQNLDRYFYRLLPAFCCADKTS